MIFRVLHYVAPGHPRYIQFISFKEFDDVNYNEFKNSDRNEYAVTHYLVVNQAVAKEIKCTIKDKSLDIQHDTYGVYEMDEEELALLILQL